MRDGRGYSVDAVPSPVSAGEGTERLFLERMCSSICSIVNEGPTIVRHTKLTLRG